MLDQSVSTTATLANIQSAFIPNFFNRAPVCELDPPTPPTELETVAEGAPLSTSTSEQELLEEADPVRPRPSPAWNGS